MAKSTTADSLTLPRDALLGVVAAVSRIVETRNTIPILANLRLTAGSGVLTAVGTDLDIEARASCLAEGALDATVPAKLLHDILRKTPEGAEVSLQPEADGSRIVVRAGRSRFTLQAMDSKDFPDLSDVETGDGDHVPAADLARAFEACAFAISTEETRYYLNGIYLHAVADGAGTVLRAAATDGHRLARFDMPCPAGLAGMPGVIVPRKTVHEMLRDLKAAGKDETVTIAVSPLRLRYASPRLALASKLIDGTYPDYTRVIPTANDKRVTVEAGALAAAADRVSTIASERSRAVKFEIGEGRIALSVANPDAGEARDEVEADYDNADLTIGFNARYLTEILAHVPGDTVLIKLAGPGDPTLLMSREGAEALYVLMPMRV